MKLISASRVAAIVKQLFSYPYEEKNHNDILIIRTMYMFDICSLMLTSTKVTLYFVNITLLS